MVTDRTASSTTLAFRAMPKDIRAYVKSVVGDPPKPMSTMEIMLAIGQAMAWERERSARQVEDMFDEDGFPLSSARDIAEAIRRGDE
ncbi:hypothetical protein [Sinorhizobium meliloti]|uniref:hypothetical protein n=1 Tax=Rhizobium meliloti TaxID=382 RepID=UPI000FD8830B|nr:hypothetical protein [Sinorhizobium meliloti]QND30844.1 hypothetical protein HB772_07345 [Sinorhizobium meliloti]RVL09192.1 hypothetical protein CN149_26035 [Sinorhizobium meliloti]WGI75316.1 hypothetical protein QC756_05405 [Sinorhizobium meliloti]